MVYGLWRGRPQADAAGLPVQFAGDLRHAAIFPAAVALMTVKWAPAGGRAGSWLAYGGAAGFVHFRRV